MFRRFSTISLSELRAGASSSCAGGCWGNQRATANIRSALPSVLQTLERMAGNSRSQGENRRQPK